jgi:hypothetical protein
MSPIGYNQFRYRKRLFVMSAVNYITPYFGPLCSLQTTLQVMTTPSFRRAVSYITSTTICRFRRVLEWHN